MEIATIDVSRREERGGKQNARLRLSGKVPAVLYGGERETLALSVGEAELSRHVRQHHKVFKLRMDGKEQAIFLQEVQWDEINDRPLHVDFVRIDLEQKMHVQVEVVFVGHPAGIAKGGRLIRDMPDVPVVCLPQYIPDHVEVKVESLDLGDRILAKDLPLPPNVELDIPEDYVICHMPGEEQVLREAMAALAEEGGEQPAEGEGAGGPAESAPESQ